MAAPFVVVEVPTLALSQILFPSQSSPPGVDLKAKDELYFEFR